MSAAAHHSPNPPILNSFASKDELAIHLAEFVVKAQKESIDKKGRFTIAISGGSLPNMLKGLIPNPAVKWDKWYVASTFLAGQTYLICSLQASLLRR